MARKPQQLMLGADPVRAPTRRAAAGCEYKVVLKPGPRPVLACAQNVEQVSALVRERTRGIGATEWASGFDLGDPRANMVGPFPVGQRAGDVIDQRTGQVIARASYNGKVWDPHDDRKLLYEPARPEPRPDPRDMQWIGWFNSAFRSGSPDSTEADRYHPEDRRHPPPALDARDRARVGQTFGLDACKRVAEALAQTPSILGG